MPSATPPSHHLLGASNAPYGAPLTRGELELIFERGYATPSQQSLAQAWGVERLDERTADLVEDAMEERERALGLLDAIAPSERLVLEALAALGARSRAERLRKDLLLRGEMDCTEAIEALIRRHAVVLLSPSGHAEIDLEQVLATRNASQYDLALPAALHRELEGDGELHGRLATWPGEVRSERAEMQQALELNLLHLGARLDKEPLRLNKSGAPHKRAASRAIEGLIYPASSHLPEPWIELDERGQDYFAFLLGLSAQLGLTAVRGEQVEVDAHASRAFFARSRQARRHALLDAIQKMRGWNEWISAHVSSQGLSEDIVELQLSQFVENGADLIGARGYLISVLRRARIEGWVTLESLVKLCVQLDRDYLPRIVERLSGVGGSGAEQSEVSRYVCAFLEHALFWAGFVKLGRGELGEKLVALSEEGREVLAQPSEEDLVEGPLATKGSLVVQPNYEVMVFLDAVTTPTLAFLYSVSERVALANRVATFKITAASVQRGYALGLDAERVVAELNAASMAPLADSVTFQIGDWERVWGRLVVYAQGVLLRHHDPDRLDDIVSELRYALRDQAPTFERLAAGSVFIDGASGELLDRSLKRHEDISIDYLAPDPPPCLTLIGPLQFAFSPIQCDVITLDTMRRIAQITPSEELGPYRRVATLDPEALRRYWPERPVQRAIAFFAPRVQGGFTPEQILRLRSAFAIEDALTVRHNLVVLELDEELADLLLSSHLIEGLFIKRYAPGAVAVDAEQAEELLATLAAIGVTIHE